MRITFDQHAITNTGKEQQNISKMNRLQIATQTGKTTGAGMDAVAFGVDRSAIPGQNTEKGKSFIELQEEAGAVDVGLQQDYMTLMSNTLSDEDYAKLQEDGFDISSMNPEEAVTIVDKIKAELVRSGKKIAGYTDDIDVETLTAALGSATLAGAVAQSFMQADLPITEKNIEIINGAFRMASQLRPLTEGAKGYLIDNELVLSVWNIYLAENSGATGTVRENAWEGMQAQVDSAIIGQGFEITGKTREAANWLVERNLPLTGENMEKFWALNELELPMTEERFGEVVAQAISDGVNPIHTDITKPVENIYEKAVRVDNYYHSEDIFSVFEGQITARRQLEEIRLRMTAEVNVKLIRSGFAIDTAPMEELVKALRKAEEDLATGYFPETDAATEKYHLYQDTLKKVAEMPSLPLATVGRMAFVQTIDTVETFHAEGIALRDTYERSKESYEALMTAPRGDLGDSIRKAFRNVDDILQDMHLELTEENRRGVRILGYNQMEITTENLELVEAADSRVQNMLKKMTPGATLKLIRDGINPLTTSFEELENHLSSGENEYQKEAQSYSKFLFQLERRGDITEAERESFIGVYRLIHQIEKSDGAAVGALVNAQAEVHFGNLLSAIRSGKAKNLDAKISDSVGALADLVHKGATISDQIGRAFVSDVKEGLMQMTYSEEAEDAYNRQQLSELREVVAQTQKETVSVLERGQITTTAENLMAAEALINDAENIFATRKKPNRGEELWTELENGTEFADNYDEYVKEATEDLEEETFAPAAGRLDVREMSLAHKQLSIAAAVSDSDEYFLPMYVGERLTRVHLTIQGGNGRTGVEISVNFGENSRVRAGFSFDGMQLNGKITLDSQDTVMNPENIADIFTRQAGERWNIGRIQTGKFESIDGSNEAGKDAQIDNMELYRVAKVFLEAVQESEVSYEN